MAKPNLHYFDVNGRGEVPKLVAAIGGLELDFYIIRTGASLADKFVDSLNTSVVSLVDEFAARVFQARGELPG